MEIFKDQMNQQEIFEQLSEYLTPRRFELIEKMAAKRTNFIIMAVDDVKKEHNTGALLRTAENFGIQYLATVDPDFRQRSARNMSIGSSKWVEVENYENWSGKNGCLETLRSRGYKLVATSPDDASTPIDQFLPDSPTAFLFGNEMLGLPEEVLESADQKIFIPTQGFSESLNVSVSAGIILFDVLKRLRSEGKQDLALPEEEKLDLKIKWAVDSIPNGEAIREKLEQGQ